MAKTVEGKLQDEICKYLDGEDYFNRTWIKDPNKALVLKNRERHEHMKFKGIFWRQNVAPTVQKGKDGSMLFRRMPKYALSGIPDIIVIKQEWNYHLHPSDPPRLGLFYGIECKQPGKKRSDGQKIFAKYCPGVHVLATSLDDVKEAGL